MAELKVVGTRPIRQDGVEKVTGRAAYGADVSMPGMLHGAVLRSPHAHARIVSIDTKRALAVPGVHAIITGRDMPDPGDGVLEGGESGAGRTRYKSENMLAREKVLYHGHAVAAVAAVDAHVAEEAARLIEVTYDPLEPVLDVRRAMEADAPILLSDLRTETGGVKGDRPSNIAAHLVYSEGDVERGLAEADVVIEREFTTSPVHQGYIETHNALANWGPGGHLVVHCSSQGQFMVRDELVSLLNWPASQITVVPTEIGGGFGGKTTSYLEVLAALLSRHAKRPVKMTMTRTEVLQATGPTPGSYERVKIGATRDGRITAMEAYLAFEAGAYPGSPIFAGVITAFGPYKLTNYRIDGFDVVVNKPKVAAYRAPGATQSEFAVESVIDEICERLEMDPIEFRMRNASVEGDLRADGLRFRRLGNVECLQAARDSAHWQTPLDDRRRKRGRGFASGFWVNYGGRSSATVRLNPDGGVTLIHGSVDIGGTRTSVAMQLAETLGIGLDDVRSTIADTDHVPFTNPTSGSRVTFSTGLAAHEAGRDLLAKIAGVLSKQWDVPADAITATDGIFTAGAHRATLREAAREIDALGLQLVGTASVFPTGFGAAFAMHIVDVEVDEETGKVRILRYTAVQDAGKAIYPPYVEGQIQGGVVQGIGWALNETYAYDENGRLRNASLLDYRMPTALDVPMIEPIIVEVPNPGHPYGVRGVGEVSIVPPPAAIANAIHAATGLRMRELPMSPAVVHAALRARESSAAAV